MQKRIPAPGRFLPAFFAALLAFAAVAEAGQRVEIVDYGIYDHTVTEVVPEPKDVARVHARGAYSLGARRAHEGKLHEIGQDRPRVAGDAGGADGGQRGHRQHRVPRDVA